MPNSPEISESNKNQMAPPNLNDERTPPNQAIAKIEIRERITREDVRAEPDKIFLFGDNLKQTGYGGQAREMRGEANARGIPTKKEPASRPTSFFTDKEFAANAKAIDEALGKIPVGKTIVVPKGGIGTGLASLEEKAPRTFDYLNEKLAEIGFDNRRGEIIVSRAATSNSVIVQSENQRTKTGGGKRLLDLKNIKTTELKLLSPTTDEIAALEINRERALANYADRLRLDYKENKENLRDGFRRLSDALDKGEQITVACACRNGEMCHADVVKMAIEKVNAHVGRERESKIVKSAETEKDLPVRENATINSQNKIAQTNPRTQRAIAEIIGVSENDRILENINQTDGRNRSEQASFLGKFSQFTRDIYERGATVREGKLLVPQENLSQAAPLAVTTNEYAVKKIGEILRDESKAKELAPTVVEYGEKISGLTADGETKLKVFAWIYDTLEGKNQSAEQSEPKEKRFENALREIEVFAAEMHALEPADEIEFVPLVGEGANAERERESSFEFADENRLAEEIYENAIYRAEDETLEEIEFFTREAGDGGERAKHSESSGKTVSEKYERIDLSENFPPLPEDFTEREATRFLSEILPEIDRQLENGIEVKEILKPFNQNVWQSQKDDALNRLEAIYQKQQIARLENELVSPGLSAEQREQIENEISRWQSAVLTPSQETLREMLAERGEIAGKENKPEKRGQTISDLSGKSGELSENAWRQIAGINIFRPTVIEIKMPAEYRIAEETAISTFFQKSKQEIAVRLTKLDEIKASENISADRANEAELKKELNQIRELKPSFAFKLENSSQTIGGAPSQKTLDERAFVQFYVNHQLKQPETRLRHQNERYRIYAARLESATTRDEIIKTASEIRAENAALGMSWKDLETSGKQNQPRPLAPKEMQFLFTETSPAHYTQAMTVARLAYAHSGASRRLMTESLLKGEISASPEAQKLIESLESRLERRKSEDSLLATKHFFESIKTPNDELKYKNEFDHREIYRRLPPQEKDFVYERAVRQLENQEYRLAYRLEQKSVREKANAGEKSRPALSRTEKSFHLTSLFHQARILGERVEPVELNSKEISERDFRAVAVLLNNHSGERVGMIGNELKQSANAEMRKVGEILEVFATAEISRAENKTQVKIILPENRLVSSDAYREMLEKLRPNERRENDIYKFSSFGEQSIEDARTKGQDASLARFAEELKQNVYAAQNAPVKVFSVERAIAEDISKIAERQHAARDAHRENAGFLAKYAARAGAQMQAQNLVVPSSAEEQKLIVRAALSIESGKANFSASKTREQFFQAAQKEITVSDFQKFAANEKIINENLSLIKNQFWAVSAKQTVLEENRFKAADALPTDKLQDVYANTRLFEENRLLTESARIAFEQGEIQISENKSVAESIGDVEKSEIRNESFNRARVALEPELKAGETETRHRQRLKLADAIETAHGLSKQNAAPEKIAEAFAVADNEKTALRELPENKIERAESKPFSLRLYEAEIERAEKDLWKKNFGAKILAGVSYSESDLTLNLDQIFSPDKREQMKTEAAEVAKLRLEPKELDADHRKIPKEASRQAMATFKQLEQAHNVFQFSSDPSKIREAFFKLDAEATALHKIRQDYSRTEKLSLLRDGVKSDIVDLLRKNPEIKAVDLIEQTREILTHNLAKQSLAGDAEQVNVLSREIGENISPQQKLADRENGVAEVSRQQDFRHQNFDRGFETGAKNHSPKNDKAKENPAYVR